MTNKTNLAVPRNLDAVRSHFDGYAASWHDRLADHPYAIRRKIVASIIGRCRRDRVADIGCGTGDYSILFDPSQSDYVGFDLSPKMIDQCRRLYPGYRFEISQAESIPLPDASVTLALNIAVLEYYEDPTAQLVEISRILEVGGDAIICVPNGLNVSKGVIEWLDRHVLTPIGRLGKRNRSDTDRPTKDRSHGIIHTKFSAAELQRLALANRLENIETRYVSLTVSPTTFQWMRLMNLCISRMISGNRRLNWVSAYFATILICRFRKMPDASI